MAMRSKFSSLSCALLYSLIVGLLGCAPATLKVDAVSANVQSSDWKARQVFSNRVIFEHPPNRTILGNAIELSLKNVGWLAMPSKAEYFLSYKIVENTPPKEFRIGSEGRLAVMYILTNKTRQELWSSTVYTNKKMSIGQSFMGSEGVARTAEEYANANIRDLFERLDIFGSSLYDKQVEQIQKTKKIAKLEQDFISGNLFSGNSIFDSIEYSSVAIDQRVAIVKNTKPLWMKKLELTSSANVQNFLNAYQNYLDSNEKLEIRNLVSQKKNSTVQSSGVAASGPSQVKIIEHKNPF